MEYIKPIIKNAIAVSIVEAINPGNFIPSNIPMSKSLGSGISLSAAEELVDYFDKGKSNITTGQYAKVIDNVIYNTVVNEAVKVTGIGSMALSAASNIPLDKKFTNSIAVGGVITGAKTFADYVDKTPSLRNGQMKYLIHPTKLII